MTMSIKALSYIWENIHLKSEFKLLEMFIVDLHNWMQAHVGEYLQHRRANTTWIMSSIRRSAVQSQSLYFSLLGSYNGSFAFMQLRLVFIDFVRVCVCSCNIRCENRILSAHDLNPNNVILCITYNFFFCLHF